MNARFFIRCQGLFLFILLFLLPVLSKAQAITGIITDYKGFWKTSLSSFNNTKPDNSHNLLAFTYNGVQYSTGVNNALLTSRGESFVPGDFWSLPVAGISSTINGNTKIGVGAMFDGVYNGASNPAPENNISRYLTDGIKGLDLGTCVANLPAGTLSFVASNIKPSAIGDGKPDIIVTQIADPTGNSFDRYQFTDEYGNGVGSYKDITFNSIAPVANWVADFYEAKNNPMNLVGGFTQTERPIRLWAADLSEFGITASNYASVHQFTISLSGNSDVAFVAYNHLSISITNLLPVHLSNFKGNLQKSSIKLDWQLERYCAGKAIVERSQDGQTFSEIRTVPLERNHTFYSYLDQQPLSGSNFYRLKLVDENEKVNYSATIHIQTSVSGSISIYPNPATRTFYMRHSAANDVTTISIYSLSGVLMHQQGVTKNSTQSQVSLPGIASGTYYAVLNNGITRESCQVIIH